MEGASIKAGGEGGHLEGEEDLAAEAARLLAEAPQSISCSRAALANQLKFLLEQSPESCVEALRNLEEQRHDAGQN